MAKQLLNNKGKYKVSYTKPTYKHTTCNVDKHDDNHLSAYQKLVKLKNTAFKKLQHISNPFCYKSDFEKFKQETLERLALLEK